MKLVIGQLMRIDSQYVVSPPTCLLGSKGENTDVATELLFSGLDLLALHPVLSE